MDKLNIKNQLKIANVPRKKYRSIWLETSDATRSEDNKYFIFDKLPLIKIKKNTKLFVNSITLIPKTGLQVVGITNENEKNHFFIKMKNIKYNNESAIASNQDNCLTLIDGYMPLAYIHKANYFVAELLDQELNFIELYINTRVANAGSSFILNVETTVDGVTTTTPTITPIDWSINLMMEYEEDN